MQLSKYRTIYIRIDFQNKILSSIFLYFVIFSLNIASAQNSGEPTSDLSSSSSIADGEKPTWQLIRNNLFFGKIFLRSYSSLFKSEIFLVRFDPKNFDLKVAVSSELTKSPTSDIKTLVQYSKGIAGINASFFDLNGKPLGLIVSENGISYGSLQLGGKLLTGIFQFKNGIPSIVHRSEYKLDNQTLAIQAGPRIIANKKLVNFSENEPYSRRSGIAINSTGEIILFATAVRFPGASMNDIQIALLNLGFPIIDALNFDGGGSSQLYVKAGSSSNDLFVSGGDEIPVGLILKEKSKN